MVITLLRWPPRRQPNTTGSKTAPKPFLSDFQWLLIADLFPDPPVGPAGGGPRVAARMSGRHSEGTRHRSPLARFASAVTFSVQHGWCPPFR